MPPVLEAFVLAVTGGIGVGKSTVTRLFAQRGAYVVDADQVAREVLAPGTPGLAEVVARFGPGVLAPAGEQAGSGERSLDRAQLAKLVFGDNAALADLEQITHPRIAQEVQRRFATLGPGTVGVYDVPLLTTQEAAAQYDLVVLVTAHEQVRLQRLEERGMAQGDAKRRMAAQIGDDVRRTFADCVVDNSGDIQATTLAVQEIWEMHCAGGRKNRAEHST